MLDVVRRTAEAVYLPLTVGGGLGSLEDVRTLLRAGADKVSLNTAAVARPELIRDAAVRFGSQCIVVAIDAKRRAPAPDTDVRGLHARRPAAHRPGRGRLGCAEAVDLGAGEILLTSMDRDGTRDGYDLELTRAIAEAVSVPVIASGGVGTLAHLHDGLVLGKADAVLAASIFHFGEHTVPEAKRYLRGARGADPSRGGAGVTAASPALNFDANGLIPAVVQEAATGEVLMVAWMNAEALERTLATRLTHFWSRSRRDALAEGRDVGPSPARRRRLRGLRRGHAPDPRAPGRGRLSHGEPHVLLRPPRPAGGARGGSDRRARRGPGNPRRGRARHPIEAAGAARGLVRVGAPRRG